MSTPNIETKARLKELRQLAKSQGKKLLKKHGGYRLEDPGGGAICCGDDLDYAAFWLKGGRIIEMRTACGMLIWKIDEQGRRVNADGKVLDAD